jgi:hypothetical protein
MVTPLSLLEWYLGFWRWYLVPDTWRYWWMLWWRPFCERLYQAHRKLVLVRCRIDAVMLGRPTGSWQRSGGARARFPRKWALRRLRGQRSWLHDAVVWALCPFGRAWLALWMFVGSIVRRPVRTPRVRSIA